MAKESTNAYGAENTKDYTEEITAQYEQVVKDRAAQTEQAVKNATEQLNQITAAGERIAAENTEQARADAAAIRATESAIAQNNGNRQQIGSSQYGVAENAYDQQRASIESARQQLQTDVSRQVADLKAQGKYEDANAALQAAQEKFRQLYEDQLRIDSNLRSNYEYQTGLRREDEAISREEAEIQRQQSEADKEWNRELGEYLLSHGVVPSETILAAMGLDSTAAKLYADTLTKSYGYSSGGSTSPSTPVVDDTDDDDDDGNGDDNDNTGTTGTTGGGKSAYSNKVASQVYSLASSGDYATAIKTLYSNPDLFSSANLALVEKTALSKYNKWKESQKASTGTTNTKYSDYWLKYYG